MMIKENKKMRTRKKLPNTALPRLYFIDEEISSGKYPNTASMAKKYETSHSSISRDIDFMKNSLGAPIEYDALHRGYYYSEKTFRLPATYTTTENMQALGMAKTLLSLYRDTPLYDPARNFLTLITAPMTDQVNPDWFENRIMVPPVASTPVNGEIWNAIIVGLKGNKTISFEYKGVWDGGYKTRRVRPYQLLFDTGVWYLYGYAEERKGIRLFSLARMQKLMVTDTVFTLPPDYDYCIKADGSHFGVFTMEKKYTFAVEFYNETVPDIRERKWAADQKITDIEGGVSISFTSTQLVKVLEWVLSRGGNARPRAPEILVKQWENNINTMKKLLEK
jgi:predicted DNA-binding transcriptional regulator YafY